MKQLIPVLLMLVAGAVARAESPQNPPPATAFAGYDRYELLPIAMGPPYAGDKGKEAAKDKVQAYMDTETNPIIAQWNIVALANLYLQSNCQEAVGGATGYDAK